MLPDGISGPSGQMWPFVDLYVGIIQLEDPNREKFTIRRGRYLNEY